MRFFRKRPIILPRRHRGQEDRKASFESMPLIYEGNHAFLKGERSKLALPQEAYENLESAIGIRRPGCAVGVGCGAVLTVSLGVLLTLLGMAMSVATIESLLRSSHLTPEMSMMAMMLTGGMIFFLFMGPSAIVQSYLMERDWAYITDLYNRLIAHGQILEGTIISVEPVIVEKVVTSQVILHYRFTVPGQHADCEGQYKLSTKETFVPGQKVTVLYLSRFIQVLL